LSNAAKILLAGGARPKNICWEVAGRVDLGTTAHGEGIILTQTAVTLQTGASMNGRLLAQTAVNIDSSTVVAPAPQSSTSLASCLLDCNQLAVRSAARTLGSAVTQS
jgi:hypothetical protein